MPLKTGETILNGKYTIQRLIGRGSYGNVWLAVDHLSGGRRVANKKLRPGRMLRRSRRTKEPGRDVQS